MSLLPHHRRRLLRNCPCVYSAPPWLMFIRGGEVELQETNRMSVGGRMRREEEGWGGSDQEVCVHVLLVSACECVWVCVLIPGSTSSGWELPGSSVGVPDVDTGRQPSEKKGGEGRDKRQRKWGWGGTTHREALGGDESSGGVITSSWWWWWTLAPTSNATSSTLTQSQPDTPHRTNSSFWPGTERRAQLTPHGVFFISSREDREGKLPCWYKRSEGFGGF